MAPSTWRAIARAWELLLNYRNLPHEWSNAVLNHERQYGSVLLDWPVPMRISIPDRLPPKSVLLFIVLVFIGQELEGTNVLFSLLTAVYNGLWATAFNTAGGLGYPSGAFILANGLNSVVIGLSAKVLLGQPGDRNLQSPVKTMLCYCVGMLMMLIVCFITRALRPRRPLIDGFKTLQQMKQASIVCLVAGIVLTVTTGLSRNSEGTLFSALRQIDGFQMMAVLLATTYEIKHSGGRRSVNWIVATAICVDICFGFIYFGKTALLMGFLAWGIAAVLQGYDFKKRQIAGLLLGGIFMVYYLVPYSQYVRFFGSRTGSASENLPIALEYLGNLNRTRDLYLEQMEQSDSEDGAHLYDHSEGFLDRLVIIAPDDQLIHFTDEGNVFGLTPTFAAYANAIPRFLWKSKPVINTGNVYAHEIGDILSDEDETTGIAYSATADAYHQAEWLGILLVLPFNLFFGFIILDTVAGNAKYYPFALLPVFTFYNSGTAAGVGAPVHDATFGLINLLVVVWTTKIAVPFVINIIKRRMAPSLYVAEGAADPARM